LASAAAAHFDNGKSDAGDDIDRVSSRPDFLILGYPGSDASSVQVPGGRTLEQ
jgi:hypothetical protein